MQAELLNWRAWMLYSILSSSKEVGQPPRHSSPGHEPAVSEMRKAGEIHFIATHSSRTWRGEPRFFNWKFQRENEANNSAPDPTQTSPWSFKNASISVTCLCKALFSSIKEFHSCDAPGAAPSWLFSWPVPRQDICAIRIIHGCRPNQGWRNRTLPCYKSKWFDSWCNDQ